MWIFKIKISIVKLSTYSRFSCLQNVMLQLPVLLVLVTPPAHMLAAVQVPVPVCEPSLIMVVPTMSVRRMPRIRGETRAWGSPTVTKFLQEDKFTL